MAIGKVDAYATVQAPNVDFGDIALNAQKFQEADLERQKELKVAQLKVEKEKPFVYKSQVLKNDSGLDFYNISQQEDSSKVVGRFFDLSKLNEEGKLDATGAAELNALQQNFENADKALKTVGEKYTEYVKGIKDHSGAFKGTEDYLQGFTADNGKNTIKSTDSNGNPYFQQVEIDSKTKKPVIGEDGKPVIRKFIDKNGVERDGWGHSDILSGRAFEPLNAFDDKGFATDVAKLVGPDKIGTDNGVTKIVRTRLNNANISTINTLIDTQVLNNRDHLADVLYKLDPIKYKDPKSEYTDEDKAFAKKGMENSIYGGISLSNVKDVNLSEGYKAQDRENRFTFVPTADVQRIGELKMPSGKFNEMPSTVAKTSYGLGKNVTFKQLGGSKTGLVAGTIPTLSYDMESGNIIMGVKTLDTKGKRYKMQSGEMVDFIKAQQEIDQLSSDGQQTLQADLNGFGTADLYKYDVRTPGAEAKAIIANSMGKSWNQIQGEIIKANKQEIDEYRRSKGKNQQTNTQSNKQISSEEFNSKWSKLKSGEKLVGPDGKTYTKS